MIKSLLRSFRFRTWLMIGLVLIIVGIFISRLMTIQIIDAEIYKSMLDGRYISTQTVRATRGEIVDRNGNPLAVNDMGYDVIIDKAFFPDEEQNEIILQLITLLERLGEDWTDNLPMEQRHPFNFLPEQDAQVEKLKTHLRIAEYATAEDTMYRLVERYNLQDYTSTQQRKIASVRYEMEQRGFDWNVTYTFATDIDISTVIQIKERSHMLSGVDVTETGIRIYPDGTIAPHIIGTIGPIYPEEYQERKNMGYAMDDTLGKDGVELAFEDYLRGENGKREIYIDARGDVLSAVETQSPVPGNTVMLTLDNELQLLSRDALERQIVNLQNTAPAGQGREADSGAVVVLNAKTGEILAAVTSPSYDLNTYRQEYSNLVADTELTPLYNRAIRGGYTPGSIFKPVVATAGLSYGIIDPTSTVNCTRVYTFYQGFQPTCLSYHGHLNVLGALQVSCNIFFYDVGRRVGIENIVTIASQYGLGEPTGIEIPENIGTRSSPEAKEADPWNLEAWSGGDVLQSSIGQLYNNYSPLQLANYAATIGNRGERKKITLVKEIRDYSMENVVVPFEAQTVARVDAPREAIETVVQGMVNASHIGTAAATFGSYPIRVASKTGTPETADLPNSTFICFAPADDPQIAIAVVIEKGWHGYTGAPVAKEIFDFYFGYGAYAGRTEPYVSPSSQAADEDEETPEETGQSSQSTAPPAAQRPQVSSPETQSSQQSDVSLPPTTPPETSAPGLRMGGDEDD